MGDNNDTEWFDVKLVILVKFSLLHVVDSELELDILIDIELSSRTLENSTIKIPLILHQITSVS